MTWQEYMPSTLCISGLDEELKCENLDFFRSRVKTWWGSCPQFKLLIEFEQFLRKIYEYLKKVGMMIWCSAGWLFWDVEYVKRGSVVVNDGVVWGDEIGLYLSGSLIVVVDDVNHDRSDVI